MVTLPYKNKQSSGKLFMIFISNCIYIPSFFIYILDNYLNRTCHSELGNYLYSEFN